MRVAVSADAGPPVAAAPGYSDVVRAFQEIGDAITADVDLDQLLHVVVGKVCELVGVRRGSLYLRDDESGLFHGQVGVALTDVDARVRELTCGVPADHFTHEILETQAPVVIADAQHDPRPIRATMRAWEVRSMLGVPMIAGGEVRGLLFLDDIDRLHQFSPDHQALASALANMAAVAITGARRADELHQGARTIARQNRLLRQAAAMEARVTALALRGGTVGDIADLLAELLGKPCAVHDANYDRLAVGLPPGQHVDAPRLMDADLRATPQVSAALEALAGPEIIGPLPEVGLHHRCLAVPIMARDETWGFVLVGEHRSRLTRMEALVASRAAAIMALDASYRRSSDQSEYLAREAVIRRLLDGDASNETLAQAAFLGLASQGGYAVALVADRGGRPLEGQTFAAPRIWPAALGDGTVALLLGPQHDALQPLRSASLQVAVSGPCESLSELPTCRRDAERVMHILRTYADGELSPALLTVDELGPALLLLAGTERAHGDALVREALGPYADTAEIVGTLDAFLSTSGGIRKTAALLQVHENTVRYRLGRIAEATGRDVLADTRAQVEAAVALLVLRLEGRLASLS